MSKKTKCDICDKELYNYEIQSLSDSDWLITCKAHREYRNVTQLWKIKQILGYEYERPLSRCSICLNKISAEELELTMPDDLWIVCEEHAPYRHELDFFKTRTELKIDIFNRRPPYEIR